MMTFKEFQATGRDVEDLSDVTGDSVHDGVPGRTYKDGTGDDVFTIEKTCEEYRTQGAWYLLLDRGESFSDDLELLERALYTYAANEGWLGQPQRDVTKAMTGTLRAPRRSEAH